MWGHGQLFWPGRDKQRAASGAAEAQKPKIFLLVAPAASSPPKMEIVIFCRDARGGARVKIHGAGQGGPKKERKSTDFQPKSVPMCLWLVGTVIK